MSNSPTDGDRPAGNTAAVDGLGGAGSRRPSVRLQAYATLRDYIGGREAVDVPVTAEITVRAVLERAGIPADQARIVLCDGRPADLDRPLAGGETVTVFPALGGG